MAAVTPQMVKELRDRTDQPMGSARPPSTRPAATWRRPSSPAEPERKMRRQAGGQRDRRGPHRRLHRQRREEGRRSSRCAARAPRRPRATSSSRWPTTSPSTSPTSKAADVPAMLVEPFGGKGTVQDRINDVGRPDPREHDPPASSSGSRAASTAATSTTTAPSACWSSARARAAERRTAPRRGRAHRGAEPAVRRPPRTCRPT